MSKRDTYVIVTVETDKIGPKNINNYVVLSDNRGGGPTPGNPINFVSKVDRGKKITWIGIPKNASVGGDDQTVDIKQIEMKKPNSSILEKTRYNDKGDNGVVVGKVKYPRLVVEELQVVPNNLEREGYYITILVNGTDWYTMDPQLEMAP